jgi:amino acid transporter
MGKNPGKEEIMNPTVVVFFVPIVGIISVFTMIIFGIRYGTQRKEREAFYRAENLRRITESSGEGAKAAIELLKEEEHLKRIKAREGMKIGGLVCVAVGVAMVIFLWAMTKTDPGAPYLVGLIPGFIGVALLVYVFFMAGPVE